MWKYYHVRISTRGSNYDEVKTDLAQADVQRRYIEPYESGATIMINGKAVTGDQLERIQISASNEPISSIIGRIQAEDMNSSVFVVGGLSDEWRAADRAHNVTDDMIHGPFGYKAARGMAVSPAAASTEKHAETPNGRSDHPGWRVLVLFLVLAAGIFGFWLLPFAAAMGLTIFLICLLPIVIAGVSHHGVEGRDYVDMYRHGLKAIPLIGRLISKEK
jgi:hypothetical protein